MVMYNADLGQVGVERLDSIFSKDPFQTRNDARGFTEVGYSGFSVPLPIIAYDSREITIYFAIVENLPLSNRIDLRDRLKRVPELVELSPELDYIVDGRPEW
jgi:hypothetical protein